MMATRLDTADEKLAHSEPIRWETYLGVVLGNPSNTQMSRVIDLTSASDQLCKFIRRELRCSVGWDDRNGKKRSNRFAAI
jgi:hypothetical protein